VPHSLANRDFEEVLMQPHRWPSVALCLAAAMLAVPAMAHKKYGPGVTDAGVRSE